MKLRMHPLAAALARAQFAKLASRNAAGVTQVRRLNDRLVQLPGLVRAAHAAGYEADLLRREHPVLGRGQGRRLPGRPGQGLAGRRGPCPGATAIRSNTSSRFIGSRSGGTICPASVSCPVRNRRIERPWHSPISRPRCRSWWTSTRKPSRRFGHIGSSWRADRVSRRFAEPGGSAIRREIKRKETRQACRSVAASMIRCSLASWRVNSAVSRPSHRTRIRSQRISSSGSSLDVTMIPRPSRQSSVHQAIQLGLGTDVYAAGRIVQQQNARPGEQPATDDRLLLIAAAQAGDRDCQSQPSCTPNAAPYPPPAGARTPLMRPPGASSARVQSVIFSPTVISANSPSRLRSSVTRAMPARVASAGWANLTSRPSSTMRPDGGSGLAPNRHSSSSVRPAPIRPAMPRISPRRSGKLMSVVASRVHARSRAATDPHFQHDIARHAVRLRDQWLRSRGRPSGALPRAASVARRVQRLDAAAVAQHRDAIGQSKDLVHLVRDVQDGHAARAQPVDDAEQPGHLRLPSGRWSAHP